MNFRLPMFIYDNSIQLYTEYGFSLILLNISSYIFILLSVFSCFFFMKLQTIKTMSDLKKLSFSFFVWISLVINFISLAGLPPLSTFVTKFFFFLVFVASNHYLLLLYFTFINVVFIFFYFQNVRLFFKKSNVSPIKTDFLYSNYSIRKIDVLFLLILLVNLYNFILIIFFEDFLLMFNFFFLFIAL